MNQIDEYLKHAIRFNIAQSGMAPAITIGLSGVIIFFYKFACIEFATAIQICAVMLFILCCLRIGLISKIKKNKKITDSQWLYFASNVALTGACFATVLTLASYELKFHGTDYAIVLAALCGFVTASLITVGSDALLVAVVQFTIFLPSIIVMMIDHFTVQQFGNGSLIFFYSLFLFYNLKQVSDYRKNVLAGFRSDYALKLSNENLQQAQQALIRQTAKLVHTSRLAALGEMAAGIAHEVNNPLAIIAANIEQIDRRIERIQSPELETFKKNTDKSQKAISRITKIIEGLRIFSQQSDQLPKKAVHLSSIVSDTLSFCEEMLKARFVKLEIGDIPQVELMCHSVQVSQVLINLIKNAEDVLAECIDLEEKWIRIEFEIKMTHLYVHVSNGGSGIDPQIVEKLFHPFFTTKPVGKGTGLGLSISRGILRDHGGDLFLNEERQATTFTLLLPIHT